ncbi:MAG: hypothetical protein AB7K24_07870 [Gemmataceae bacterium]
MTTDCTQGISSHRMDGQKQTIWWRLRLTKLRVVIYLFLALLVLEVAIRAQRDVWRSYEPIYYRDRLEAACRQPLDAVFVGASPVMSGIETDILSGFHYQGKTCSRVFNLGLPLATTPDVFHVVEHVLAKKPALIVYGITPADVNSSRRVPEGVHYLIDTSDVPRAVCYFPRRAPWLLGRFAGGAVRTWWALYDNREGIRRWLAECFDGVCPGVCSDAAQEARNGQATYLCLQRPRGLEPTYPVPPRLRYSHLKATGQATDYFPFLDNFEITGYLPYLDGIIDQCAEAGVPLVLVRFPGTEDLENRVHRSEFAQFDLLLDKLEAEGRVRILTPTREEIGLTDADFTDLIHLNADGSRKFSIWLHDALNEDDAVAR